MTPATDYLMRAPTIVGFHLASSPRPGASGVVCLAKVTVECGALILKGLRLCRNAQGLMFFQHPRMEFPDDRVVLRAGPERDALLVQAVNTLRELAPHLAASPLATAPETTEPSE